MYYRKGERVLQGPFQCEKTIHSGQRVINYGGESKEGANPLVLSTAICWGNDFTDTKPKIPTVQTTGKSEIRKPRPPDF